VTGSAVVLLYHRIGSPPIDPFHLAVSPQRFEEHLDVLAQLGQIRPLVEVVSDAEGGRLDGLSFAITFDDGYADNLSVAAPILEKHGSPATVFVITDYLDGGPFWWDELASLLRESGAPGAGAQPAEGFSDLWARCRALPEAERRVLLTSLPGRPDSDALDNQVGRSLSQEELLALARFPGVEIGAHTRTHPILASLEAEAQRREITGSKAALEEALGRSVTAFAYPYGGPDDYCAETIELVRESGFDLACSAVSGAVKSDVEPLQIPRLQVRDWDGEELACALDQVAGQSRPGGRPRAERKNADAQGIEFGNLRRLRPLSRHWGFDRGRPVDRYYIERFLEERAASIRGRVLEIGEPLYAEMFGGDRIRSCEILDVSGSRAAAYTSRLEEGPGLPSDAFDCAIVTQTLQLIYDVRGALRTLHRLLRPGGVLLVTVPGITKVGYTEYPDGWFWSFTAASVRRLAAEAFPGNRVEVVSHGNVLAATAFLYGLSSDELDPLELDYHDPEFEVTIGLQAVRQA
jgi:peptidoglycan/xylan/chitin deacetylase (PgdA/CDA1 family)/SAM-dependent methyltransferase